MTPRPNLARLREAAFERADGLSDLSGRPLLPGWELHHRRPGGKGGTRRPDQHTLSNVVCLNREEHANNVPGSVHDNRDDWARKWGFLLPLEGAYSVPELVPIRWRGGDWHYLPETGGFISAQRLQAEVLQRQKDGRLTLVDDHPHPGGPPA